MLPNKPFSCPSVIFVQPVKQENNAHLEQYIPQHLHNEHFLVIDMEQITILFMSVVKEIWQEGLN